VARTLRENESIELFALGSSDRLARSVYNADPALIKSENTGFDFGRVMIKYRYQMPDGATLWITPSIGRHVSTLALTSKLATVPDATLDVHSNVYGCRAGWRGRVTTSMVVTAGLDLEAATSDLARTGAVTSPPREGDIYVFGQALPDRKNVDTWQTT